MMKQIENSGMFKAALGAALLACGSFSTALAAQQIGVVGANSATLTAKGEDGTLRTLKSGDPIYLNDDLATNASGRAQIIFQDRSTVAINENAQLRVDSFVYDPAAQTGKLSMNSVKGVFRFIGGVLSKKQPVEIHTPVATIGIRGGIVDAAIAPDTGATNSVFVYGQTMTLQNGNGEVVEMNAPGGGFTVATAEESPRAMTRSEVQQSTTQFSKTEGGATEGVQQVPTREQTQEKASSMPSDDNAASGGDDGQGTSSQQSSNSDGSGDDGSGGGSDDGGTAVSQNDQGATQETSAQSAADSTAVAPSAQTDAPRMPETGGFVMLDAVPSNVIGDIATTVSQNVSDAVTDQTVKEITTADAGKDDRTGLPPVNNDDTNGRDPVVSTDDDPTPPVVTPTNNDRSGSSSNNSDTSSGSSDATPPSTPTFVAESSVALPAFVGSGNGVMASNGSLGNVVRLQTGHVGDDARTAITITGENGDTILLPTDLPDHGSFTRTLTSENDHSYTLSGFHSEDGAMQVLRLTDAYGMQISSISGRVLQTEEIAAAKVNTGEAFYHVLPEVNHYIAVADIEDKITDALSDVAGLYVNYNQNYMLASDIDWLDHGAALETGDDGKRILALGRLQASGLNMGAQVIQIQNANSTQHAVRAGTLSAQEYYQGADNGLIEGIHATWSGARTANAGVNDTLVQELPMVRDSNGLPNVSWLDGATATEDRSGWRGYAAGLLNLNYDNATPTGMTVYTSGNELESVRFQADQSNARIGMFLSLSGDGTPLNVGFGSYSSAPSVYHGGNVFAAVSDDRRSFVASSELVGVTPNQTYAYTQWGVWGGDTSTGGDNSHDVAELVPFVVGQVTQDAGQLSGTANYRGDAYASIANAQGLKNYHGEMSATVNFGMRRVSNLNINFNDVSNDQTVALLSIKQAYAYIPVVGNASFTNPLSIENPSSTPYAEYNGITYRASGAQIAGALFGPNAEEMAGNFKFDNIAGMRGAGVYQGVTHDTITRTPPPSP